MSELPQFVRRDRLAEILGVSKSTLEAWESRPPKGGAPPCHRIGRAVIFDVAEVVAWLKAKDREG